MLIRTNVTNIGDPFVLNTGENYYMYATSFDVEGFKVWKSDNLREWECLGVCLDLRNSWAFQDFWAPEVIYYKGRYIMHYTATRRTDQSLQIGVAVSERPEGPFQDVHNGPMFDLGYGVLDGHVFEDEDGKAYFYYSKAGSDNYIEGKGKTAEICVCELSDDRLSTKGEHITLFGPSESYDSMKVGEHLWNEAPYVLKRDGIYYLTYSANFYQAKEYCVCLAKAEHPCGPFVKQDNAILTYKDVEEDFSGPGHGAFFNDYEGNLKISFHIHTHADAPSGDRKACISDVKMENGTIVFVL